MGEPPPAGGPKTKAHFSKLLTDAGVPHTKTMKLDEIKKLCMEHRLIEAPKFTERDRLATLLDLANVTYPKKASAGVLHDLCVANGLEDPEFEEFIEYSTVKCGLQSAMSLGEEEYGQFNQHVEAFVERVSRMMRRASLALSFHVTRQLRLGLPIDDLYNQKDTYWKDWMRVGLNDTFPTPAEAGCSVTLGVEEDGSVRVGIKDVALFVRESFQLVGPVLDRLEPDSPMYFDQVLTYASRLLQTVVTNNAWVPLFKRLGRLAKIMVGQWREAKLVGKKDMYADRLMTAVRSADPAMDTFPECARQWVKDVRTRLHVNEGAFVFDNHGHKTMTFEQAARFNMWMQTEFKRLEARGIKVMPVVNVGRQHVRLDTKTLNFLICSLFPNNKNVMALKELSRGVNPDKILLPQAPEKPPKGSSTTTEYKLAVKEHKALVEEIKAGSEYTEMMKAYLEHKATMTKMAEAVKPVIPKAPKKPNPNTCSPEEMVAYKREKEAHERVVTCMKAGGGEAADIKAKLDAARLEVASGVFGNIPKRKDWSFSGMVVTDGVAVSILYQRTVRRQVVAKTKKKAARVKAEEKIASTYDPHLTTVLDDVAVVGLDPGRTCLACVAYVFTDKNGVLRYKSWRLSRGHYYEKSGIMSAERRKAKQWASMKAGFTTLAGATLKAVDEAEILEYLRLAGNISDAWWGLALLRRESRDALGAYMGKRRVLDRFFAKIHRHFRKEGKQVEIAYGEAGLTMNPTGRGEVAVPTGGTYKAAIRAFGEAKVKPTDESHSTKNSWETGAVKGRVYMRADRTLGHTNEDKTPVVPENEKAAVMQLINDIAEKRRSTRGGGSREPFKPRGGQLRYPEVRGLRFCNETRKYVDRDLTAAMTIARLRVMEILGLGRPAPFARNQNNDPTI